MKVGKSDVSGNYYCCGRNPVVIFSQGAPIEDPTPPDANSFRVFGFD
jgi:hypothetical protein